MSAPHLAIRQKRFLRKGLSFTALIAITAQGHAADLCDPVASAALKTAAVQQELMVAGFTCGAARQYNRFVIAHQMELRQSDANLMAYFKKRDHGREAGYDSYKTKAANLSAYRSARDGALYCRAVARDFQAAEHSNLMDFTAGAHLLIPAPDACAVKYDHSEMASAHARHNLRWDPWYRRYVSE
ncbi:MAG TPA: hypothetical protein VMO78_00270 [Rhizomicrobium sp.]|nr:hypothetical protein [Rhizomicrobium sp.]